MNRRHTVCGHTDPRATSGGHQCTTSVCRQRSAQTGSVMAVQPTAHRHRYVTGSFILTVGLCYHLISKCNKLTKLFLKCSHTLNLNSLKSVYITESLYYVYRTKFSRIL